jgi:hypothetical protein
MKKEVFIIICGIWLFLLPPSVFAGKVADTDANMDAVGTEREADETKEYITELEADIMPIDNLIAFAGSEAGAGYFGAELAKNITAHAEEIKLAGAEYCDCPACAAVAEILARKKELL